jgi:hypothetical protein
MMLKDDTAIERLARAMMDCSLPKVEWTHEGHFAAALWLLRYRPDLAAPEAMRGLIMRYNESTDTPNTESGGYHHSITIASIRAAAHHLAGHDGPLHEVLAALMASVQGRSDWLLAHWNRDTLFSVAARRNWVPPDLVPLPF